MTRYLKGPMNLLLQQETKLLSSKSTVDKFKGEKSKSLLNFLLFRADLFSSSSPIYNHSSFAIRHSTMFWGLGRTKMPDAMSIVELQVHMDCEGCERRIRKAISKLDGVDTIDIDLDKQKVLVTGYVDRRKVLKVVRRTGRRAEFWPFPYDSEYHPYALQYLEDSSYSSTYNYYRHGYNSTVQGYFPNPAYSTIVDDHTATLFNDDNVHACVIM